MTQDYDRRFSTLSRLYEENGLKRLAQSHVVVVGIGGVGSWAVEALARSGVGKLTLIDLDNIAESNINRQIHALSSTIGQSKVEAMKSRILEINERCEVVMIEDFLTADNLAEYLTHPRENYWILDAMDEVRVKAALIAFAKRHRYKMITTGAAGGKTRAEDLMIDDLNKTFHDPLSARLKALLRKDYDFPAHDKKAGIPIVFSKENSQAKKNASGGLNCQGYGSIVTVTATMGLMAASYIINKITGRG
ncbi:tRNA threonylcarbamoyladenosine dehydratase [Ignatzschineria rhizosphaerae]|uniref:tRNA threonylcarbamoyladenosine dehydratase n=1 Tax=Ignatzschineria rhizosphaerae TaxID=2923279 RepID=A0ABY3X2Y0_9GAMM|nr:tRNA threonylcarbamoyladenosine dehydratase [Ignatzschineria rhizosphaerae]UNM96250.1 tRNA threonylcarbamoyladenosine dehydratase [Ignatzschineria rhizosphaerae]